MKQKINNYILNWNKKGYFEIPEEVDLRIDQLNKAPSYKKICFAILKNDYSLKTLNQLQIKTNSYHELKRIELGIINNQLKLNL